MPKLEIGFAVPPPLIDLSAIEERQRATRWAGVVRSTFPTLSVQPKAGVPSTGSINRIPLGAAELFVIASGPAAVTFAPPRSTNAYPHLSLMVQSRGTTFATQGGGHCLLTEGDMCLIDEAHAFQLLSEECGEILLLRLPRAAVLSRYPQIRRLFARVLTPDEPGTRLLAETLQQLPAIAANLGKAQHGALVGAVVQMLGVAGPLSTESEAMDWRARSALDFIECNYSVAGLTAEDVARHQRISRRRLDQIMTETVGLSVARQLWNRRMEQAALDLRDPRQSGSSVAQIAFAVGFEDPAHFSRAFKRRYSVTPAQWRLKRAETARTGLS